MALLLGGCGALPDVVSSAPPPADSAESPEVPTAEAIAAENPYLDSRRSVSNGARQRFAAATAAMAAEDWETARADLEWLVENHPKLSGPYLNLALLSVAEGELDAAETHFQAALDVNKRNLVAYNQYAIFLREQGRFDESEQVYLAALAVWSNHAETHRNIGVLYDLYRGEREKALQHYYRYQELTGNTDRTVAGWIVLLERQFSQVVLRGQQGGGE
ncbi:MAG: tetratricopeptide repeat protein [Gammaproteobacteria bacterium]|nr:tetratricopeptide repeat protein [Gammaproteobacteria bacterium]